MLLLLCGLGAGLGKLGPPAHRLTQHICFERVCIRQNAVDTLVGGVLLFSRIEKRLGIVDVLASCVTDTRDPASTPHGNVRQTELVSSDHVLKKF